MADPSVASESEQDIALVRDFQQGDERVFDSIFHRHKRGVYNLAYRTAGAELAEDVMQEVFIQVYKSLGRFRATGSFRAWLYRITLNVCRDSKRWHNRRATVSYDESPDMLQRLSCSTSASEDWWMHQQIETMIQDLSESERIVVELHYMRGLSYAELAEALGCPTGTVKARVHSAISKLRLKLLPLIEQEV